MAETLVHTIQFIEDNPYGTFVAGDIVSIYYDPTLDASPTAGSTTGYTVKKNGSAILSGNDVLYFFDSGKIESSASAQICNGTTLVQAVRQITYFPYVFSFVEPDYPSCAVDPNTCDLIIIGTPVVSPASGETTADGEITVSAQSSLPIQYRLSSDFLYNDGTAQSDGRFFGLTPGTYRIYIRDSANCSTNVLVNLSWDDSYGPLFRHEFNDVKGNVNRIDIVKRAYAGAVTEVNGDSGSPFERSLRGEGVIDKFESILSTDAVARFVSSTNFQFQQLFTNNPEEFKLNYYKDLGNTIAGWTPAVLPSLSSWTNVNDASVTESLPLTQSWAWTTGATPVIDIGNSTTDGYYRWSGDGSSDFLYTSYSFESSRFYTFSYDLQRIPGTVSGYLADVDLTVSIKIFDASYNTLLEKLVTINASTPNPTGEYSFLSPYGATGIGIKVKFASFTGSVLSQFSYRVNSFTNLTPSESAGPAGFELQWTGFCLPQQYQEEYTKPPYPITVRATDGLASLKDIIFLQDDGQRFDSTMRQIELVAYILKKLKLNLQIRVACNLYADDMSQGDTDDPFDQGYIDTYRYYLTSDEPTLEFVLRAILEPYGASIVQEGGYWNIVRVEEKKSSFDYRVFDQNGVLIANDEYDPIVNIDSPSQSNRFMWSDVDQNLEICPGYGKIILYYDLGLKNNILRNGDFRLKSQFDFATGSYFFTIDKSGFQLINAGYPLTEGYERSDENGNVSYLIRSSSTSATGEAYILSETINLKMGVKNSLKIKVRFKLPQPRQSVPYQKIRLQVRYGSYYLMANGRWSTDVNELIFFVDKFEEYTEVETIAYSPSSSAANGFDFNIRLYHSFVRHTDYTDYNDLISISANDADQLPTGTRKQVYSTQLNIGPVTDYFELQESEEFANQNLLFVVTDRGDHDPILHEFPSSAAYGTISRGDTFRVSDDGYIEFETYNRNVREGDKLTALIDNPGFTNSADWAINYEPKFVVPDGYVWGTNEKQWAFRGRVRGTQIGEVRFEDGSLITSGIDSSFWVDVISVEYLYNGQSPYDTIVREVQAESRNKDVLEKKIYHGSYSDVIQTINLSDKANINFAKFYLTKNSIVTANILSADVVYSGYIRNSDGEGFETWKRDGIAESTSLHAILLNSYATQYKRPWRKITGTLYSNDRYFTFIDTLKEVNDSNRLYIPIGVTIDEKKNTVNGEFLELIDITTSAGSNGSGSSPFSSAFTNGFGSGYN